MAAPIETLYIELQGRLDGLERSLKQAEQRLAQAGQDGGEAFSKGFGTGVEQVITKIGSVGAIVAGGAIGLGAFDGLVRSVFSLAQEADRANTQAQLLSATLERNGISATAAEQSFRKTADALGVLPQQLNESSKLLINYGATLDQVAKLQEIGGASALAAGRSAADGADLIAQAITTENSALLNGIGIASNLSTAYQNYGKEVGKTVEQLTAQEKAQAAVNYLLKETQSEVEALPTLLGGLAGSTNEINQRFTQLRQTLGEQLIPIVNAALKGLIGFADILPTLAPAVGVLAAAIGAQRLAGAFSILNVGVFESIRALGAWAASTVTTTSATTALSTALRGLQAFFLSSPALIIAAGAALVTFAQQASSAIRAAEQAAAASDRATAGSINARIAELRNSGTEIDQLKSRIVTLQNALSSIRLGELGGNAEATAAKIKELRQELAQLEAAQKKTAESQAVSNAAYAQARQLIEAQQKALASLNPAAIFAAEEAIKAFNKANDPGIINAVRAALAEQERQTKANEKATVSATKALSEWQNYLKSERLEAYKQSLSSLNEAQLRTEVANQRASQSVDRLQAATQQLTSVQTRRLEVERELAAAQANAPIQSTIGRLAQQYDLANISLQEYLASINRYLQVYSQQLAVTAKGTDEYDRLRGVILQLRDVQRQLTTELEVQADAQAKLAASAPLTATITALANQYDNGAISARQYADALEALIQSFATQRNTFASTSIEYQRLDSVIKSLRETQLGLAPAIREAAQALEQQARAAINTAEALRLVDEGGRFEIFDAVAKQYVALKDLIERGDIGPAARTAAEELRKSFSSVRIDEQTKSAVGDLLKQFDDLAKSAESTSEKVKSFDFSLNTDQAQVSAQGLIAVYKDIVTEIAALSTLSKAQALSTDELSARYDIQKMILAELVTALEEQAQALLESGASAEELASTFDALSSAKQAIDDLSVAMGNLATGTQLVAQSAPSAVQQLQNFVTVSQLIQQDTKTLSELYKLNAVSIEQLSAAYQNEIDLLEAYQATLTDLVAELRLSGNAGQDLLDALQAIGATQSRIDAIRGSLAALGQDGGRSLLALSKSDPSITFEETYAALEELRSFLAENTVPDEASALVQKLRRALTLVDVSEPLKQEISKYLNELETLKSELAKVGESFVVGFDPTIGFEVARQLLKDVESELGILDIQLKRNIITTEDYVAATKTLIDRFELLVDVLSRQGDELLAAGNATAAFERYKAAEDAATKVDELNESLKNLSTNSVGVASDFRIFNSVVTGISAQLKGASVEFDNGAISSLEYEAALGQVIDSSKDLITELQNQRDAIDLSDQAGQDYYSALSSNIAQLVDILNLATVALESTAKSSLEAARALRILQETSNEDVTQQVREGLARLEELLSTGVINDEVLQLSDQLTELAGQSLPPDVRQWFNQLMQDLSDVRGFLSSNIAETLAYSNANRDLTSSIAQTVDALRRSGERIVTIDDALASFKKFKIEVDSTQLEALRNYLYLTRTDFDDFVQASIEAARQLPQAELIDFSAALEGLGLSLSDLQAIYAETGQSSEEYRTAIIDTIGDLETFIGVVEDLARSYSDAAEESDRVVGAKLAELADRARGKIDDLNDELFRMTEQFKAVNTEIQGFDRETRTLANVQIPDVLPDKDFQALLKSLNVDLGSVEQLGAALSQLPESLRGTGALYQDLTSLVDLTTQGQNKLAESAGYAQSENQKLGTQIKTLAQDLLVLGTITPEVALGYIELANQIEKIPEAANKTKSAIDPFEALANLSFENFTELAVALDRVLNPISETANAADLLQDALREAAEGEKLLSKETAKVDNEFSRQAATIRDYATQLEATKNVAPDLIKQLRDLALALDIQSLVEDGIQQITFTEDQLSIVDEMARALEGINDAAFKQTDTYKVLSEAIKEFNSITEKSIELSYGSVPRYVIEADRLKKNAEAVRGLGKEYELLAQDIENQVRLYLELSKAAEQRKEQEELNKKLAAEAEREAEKARRELEQEADRLRREAEARFNQIVGAITGPLGSVVAQGIEKAIYEGLSDSEIEKFVREELTKQLIAGAIGAVVASQQVQDVFKDFANELAVAIEYGGWENIGINLGNKLAQGIELGTQIITDAATTLREVLGDSLKTTANEVEAIANDTASKFANPFDNLKPTTLVFGDVFAEQANSIRKLRQDFEKTVTEEYRSATGTISGAINSALGNALKQVATGGNKEQVRQALRKTLIEGLIAAAIDVAIAQGQLGKLVQDIAASFIGQSNINLRQALSQIDETVARVLGLFDQFSGDLGTIDLNLGINIGVAVEEIISDAQTRVQELKEAISGIFQNGISDALFEAVQGGNYEDIKKELDANLKKSIVKVIIDTAVQAALASSAVSVVLANLSKAISAAIRTGDWSQVGAAINQAVSTVSNIMDQLSAQLIPNLSGLFPQPGAGGQTQIPGFNLTPPTGAGAVPIAPGIQIPGLTDTGVAITGAAEGITNATDALITGLTDLELPTVAADFARSTADFRVAVDDLSAILSNNTNWEGVGSR